MILTQAKIPSYAFLILPLGLLLFLVLFVSSGIVLQNQLMIHAISYDFIFTIPIIYYFVVRKTSIPTTSIIPFFIACVFLANISIKNDTAIVSFLSRIVVPLVE